MAAFVPRQLRLEHKPFTTYDIDVQTNSFKMDFPTKIVHHYDGMLIPFERLSALLTLIHAVGEIQLLSGLRPIY